MDEQTGLVLTLRLVPRPKPSIRCGCRNGLPYAYAGKENKSSQPFKAWRKLVTDQIRIAWAGRSPLAGPLRFSCTLVVKRPGTRPATSKHITRNKQRVLNPRWERGEVLCSRDLWKSEARIPCPKLPDLDNYLKALKDILTDASVWYDDGQVAAYGNVGKWYAAKGEEPHIRLRVEPL